MVKVGKCALMHKKWTFRVELTKKTSHCKSRYFLRKRRLKNQVESSKIKSSQMSKAIKPQAVKCQK